MNKRRLLRSFTCISLVLILACTPFFSADAFGQAPQGDSVDAVQEQPVETDQQAGGENEEAVEADSQDEEQLVEEETAEEESAVEPEVGGSAEDPSDEAKTEYHCSVDGVEITAVLSDADIIPDGAKLSAARITDQTSGYNYDAYMEALNAGQETVYSENNTLLYDIAFIKDGKEIQPDGGTVAVTFDFKNDQLSDQLGIEKASDLSITHLPLKNKIRNQYDTTKAAKAIEPKDINKEVLHRDDLKVDVDRETVAFELDSFSVVAVSGRGANATYEVLPPDADTFTGSSMNKLGGDFGELANFGLIGFTSIDLQAHTNSNFASKDVNMGAAVGTNNLADGELFYIQNSLTGGNNFNMTTGANGAGGWNGSMVVFGSGMEIQGIDSAVGTTAWKFTVDGVKCNVNGPKLEDNAIRQEEAGKTFIDLESYRAKAVELSQRFADFSGTKVNKKPEADNTTIIERPDATVASINLTAEDMAKKVVVNDNNVDGRDHILIINVDANGESELTIPGLAVTSSGYTGEVSEWTKGNVILNIIDSSQEDKQYRGKITATGAISASILAPYSDFSTGSNVNGQIFADKILIGGEFHRDSITFTNYITVKGGLKAAKEVDGSRDLGEYIFEFVLKGLDGAPMPGGGSEPTMTVESEVDGLILFGYITFETPGNYRYSIEEKIPEDAELLPDGRKYKNGIIYDTTKYIVEVKSKYKDGPNSQIVIDSYKIFDETGTNEIDAMTYDAGKTGVVTFKNNTSDGKANIKATKAFDGWQTRAKEGQEFTLKLRAKSFVDKDGNEQWEGKNGAQYKLPTTEQNQQWQMGSREKTVTVSKDSPLADFGTLAFVDQNGHIDDTNLGTYTYVISENIPSGATYSADGTIAVKDGVIYDAAEHIVTVKVVKTPDGHCLVTTEYDGEGTPLTITNTLDKLTVEKKWFTNGQDITADTNGEISYDLMRHATRIKQEKEVGIYTGGDQNNVNKAETVTLTKGAQIKVTSDNQPTVKTFENGSRMPNGTDLNFTSQSGKTYTYVISNMSAIKDNIGIAGNNMRYEIIPAQDDSSADDTVADTKVNDEPYKLQSDNNWKNTHESLPVSGSENGKDYNYTYYVVENPVPDGYTASYSTEEGINGGTITITNSKDEEEEHANLKVRKTFADGTLTDAEKSLVEFTVNGPDGFAQTRTYAQFEEGVWDLGEVAPGQYAVTERNAAKDGYILSTTYRVDGEEAQQAGAILEAGDDITIELINRYVEDSGEDTAYDSITITKKDQDGEPLDGAMFKLYEDEELTEEVASYEGGTFDISTEDPKLAGCLPTENGANTTLYLKEIAAPAGYSMDTATHPVVITRSAEKAFSSELKKFITTTTYSITIEGKAEIDITNTQKTGTDRADDSVTITKKDQDGEVLENAQFKLFEDQACEEEIAEYTGGAFTISTDDEELASFLPTKNGASTTLYLQETEAPAGYDKDKTVHAVVITATITTSYDADRDAYITLTTYEMTIGGEAEIDVTNTQKTGEKTKHDKISITKKDQDGEKLSGAEFKLYKEEACTTEVDSYTGGEFEISTDAEALAEYLPAEDEGTVTLYLKETKAPAGYNMDETAHPVVITTSVKTAYDEEKDAYITTTSYGITIDGKAKIDVTNNQKTGEKTNDDSITITKKDQDGEPLNNAQFKLFEDESAQTAVTGAEYSGGSFVISTKDTVLKSYLPEKDKESATLYLKETKAPAGYNMDETAHPVVIKKSVETKYDADEDKYITTTSYEMTIDGEAQIDVTNNQKKGETTDHDSVMITKKDQDGAPLKDAQFELYRDQGCTDKIRAYTSGADGIFAISTTDAALKSLLPGKDAESVSFFLKETKAPAGYGMDETIHEVVVTADVRTAYDSVQDMFITSTTYEMTIGGKAEIDVTNTQNTDEDTTHSSVTITKKDQDGEPLKDAEFKLYSDEDCQNEIGTFKSGADGTFTVSTEDAALGSLLPDDAETPTELYLKESVPPKGYALDETVHPVVITVGYSTALVAAKNAFVTTTAYAMTIDGDTTADITNEEEQKGIITLKKTGKEDAPLNGAEFDLYRVGENSATGDEKINDNPLVTINDGTITVGDLEPGTYYFVETKAPKGYVTPEGEDAKTGTAEVLAGQSTPQVCTINFANAEEGKGQIILTKKDENSSEVLEGASFDLYKVKEGNETEDVKQNTAPYVTDENGVITANNLEPGDYYFVETEAPKEYALPEDPKTETVTIKAGQKDAQIIRIDMTNERAYGRLLLTKEIEEYIGGKSTNATFTFRITGGSKEDGTYFDESRGVHFDADSNKAQTISMAVPLGIELKVEEVFTGNYEPEQKSLTLDPEDLKIEKEDMIDIDPDTGEIIKIPYYKVSFKNNLVRTNKTKSIINEYGASDGETVIVDRIGKDD